MEDMVQSEGGTLYELVPAELENGAMEEDARRKVAKDNVAELLGDQFEPDIIDEVREFSAPPWEASDESLDPIEDLEDYALHEFRMPPPEYKAVQDAAQQELAELDQLRGPADPKLAARVAQRRALVQGRTAQDVAWLKTKAYHRAMRILRQRRLEREDASAAPEDGEAADVAAPGSRAARLAAKGAPLDVVPAALIDLTPADAAARAAAEAEAAAREAAAGDPRAEAAYARAAAELDSGSGNEDGSEAGGPWWLQQHEEQRQQPRQQQQRGGGFDASWLSPDLRKHPLVLGTLAAALSSALGADVSPPTSSPAAVAAADRASAQLALAHAGGPGAVRRALAAVEAAATAAVPEVARAAWVQEAREAAAERAPQVVEYTEEHTQRLARAKALQRYRAARSGAFWLALLGSAGLGVYRWLRDRRRAARRAAAAAAARAERRAGARAGAGGSRGTSVAGSRAGRASSVASSDAVMPVVLEG
ncbi:hypothetical protein MNEG_2877 [Monoraphidium neglectum]|uniref:Uncharacterized protein n=1 Tax=Monoraphidium neglectum TaxID=145388 RepID=A0A0D2NJQ6_9CHLO|nr:hypothetical protein MNEG_2877 [Monoraphidium neglectum]KIZ05086.1 hypothetical protein MNEG_2877 [Monoraphidium neglectum]|eukprot:XP_013904105.1 hypothetical protein MNEG_2877 [Monoraphidium neglectum]